MSESFISEPIAPLKGPRDTAAMARGEPGLPSGFRWREEDYEILDRIDGWKTSSPEGGKAGNEVYLRRHYFVLRMSDKTLWTVYFTRQGGSKPKSRWFLYTIAEEEGLGNRD